MIFIFYGSHNLVEKKQLCSQFYIDLVDQRCFDEGGNGSALLISTMAIRMHPWS